MSLLSSTSGATPGDAHARAVPGVDLREVKIKHTDGSGGVADVSRGEGEVSWTRSNRPLKVAILGWARLSSQAKEGSGYNLNASELARGLALSGHSVWYLSSGMTFRLGLAGAGRTHLTHREDWGDVKCFEIRNAPNLSPAAMNFSNMQEEMQSPATTKLVLGWLDEIGAQVVHVHSLEGFGLDLIGAVEASGRPVIVTPHNYWYACPQVDLLHHERQVCEDYEGGKRCAGCLPEVSASKARRLRAFGQSLERHFGVYPADVVRKMAYGVKPTLKAMLRGRFSRATDQKQLNPERHGDSQIAWGFETDAPGAARHDATLIEHDLTLSEAERGKDYCSAPVDQNERIIANRDKHLVVLNSYGSRRQAGIRALNAATLVTPPSDYLRRVMVSMGVKEERTRWVRLGQPHFDQINRRTRRSPFYTRRPWDPSTATRPLRFAFFGTTRANKGLEVLARAIPLIEPSLRRRAQFTIRAQGWEWPVRKRLAKYPEVTVWGGYDLYQLLGSGGEYDIGILSHIWLENSPLVLLENLHAGKFVISSRLGGPVDWIVEPHTRGELGNGLLFPGGDERALARAIERCISGDVIIPSAEEVHQLTTLQTYPGHVREVEDVYHEALRASMIKRRANSQ